MLGVLARQTLRTHRPFKATIMDKTGKPVLWVRQIPKVSPGWLTEYRFGGRSSSSIPRCLCTQRRAETVGSLERHNSEPGR
jgi:hypothetical protein